MEHRDTACFNTIVQTTPTRDIESLPVFQKIEELAPEQSPE